MDRFWSKVSKSADGCWCWTANRNNKGYGLFRPGGTLPKVLAHRFSYEAAHGPIPKGAFILHSCDNPACVNPAHLRIGNAKQNVADMDARNRRRTNPKRGTRNHNSRLTDAAVLAIRRAYVSGVCLSEICETHGISRNSLSDYTSGRAWAHLLPAGPSLVELRAEAARRRRSGAKLTPEIASAIRHEIAAGATQREVAKRYGVHYATVSDIHRGLIWRE